MPLFVFEDEDILRQVVEEIEKLNLIVSDSQKLDEMNKKMTELFCDQMHFHELEIERLESEMEEFLKEISKFRKQGYMKRG